MKKSVFNILLIILICELSWAQNKYWVYFDDKQGIGTDCSENPRPDISQALDGNYLKALTKQKIQIVNQSKWLNAVSAILTREQLKSVGQLHFVRSVEAIDPNLKILNYGNKDSKQVNLGTAISQINGKSLLEHGLNGKGVEIGIIDGGFLDADKSLLLKHVIERQHSLQYRNYIDKSKTNPYIGEKAFMDGHGTKVWELIAGFDPKSNKLTGLASAATFYLARTDQGEKEFRGEEDYWVAALEWMDSLGVKLINSSVGYSTGYDNPKENYSASMVTGKSSAITKAAQIAVKERGMTIVLSAGNDGNNKFKVLSLPADAPGAIAVGATNKDMLKMGYSAIGPENLGYLKPNLSCYSLSGTSFSAPVITGLIACMMQADSTLTNNEIVKIIEKSCHLYPYGNNYIGYGVPDANKILTLLENPKSKVNNAKLVKEKSNQFTITTNQVKPGIVFHKKDLTNVLQQNKVRPKGGKITVNRLNGSAFSTLYIDNKVIEIKWL